MSASSNATNLLHAGKELAMEWERTKTFWRDAKSAEFEETYLKELPHHLLRTAAAIEEIDGLLQKIRRDCE